MFTVFKQQILKRDDKKSKIFQRLIVSGLLLQSLLLTACTPMTKSDMNSYADDKGIEIASAGIVTKLPYENVARINVLSMNGNVLMVGQSPDPLLTARAEKSVSSLAGVKQVYNQIRQDVPITLAQVATDTWITTKVKAAILTSSLIKDTSIKVLTENNEVFLLGFVTQSQAEKAAELARNIDGVRQVVKVFQIVQ